MGGWKPHLVTGSHPPHTPLAGSQYLIRPQLHTMSHISLTYHVIWRTKRSERTIAEEHERELYAYIHGMCKDKKCHLYRINSMPDHVHMCIEVHPTLALSTFMQVIKQESSRWIEGHKDWFPHFDGWGNGYAAFSYSAKDRPTIIEYIKNQKQHHHKATFREEYETLMREFGLDPEKDMFLKD